MTESIQCWSCGTRMTLEELASNDGDCHECEVEIHLAEYLSKALAEIAELRAQLPSQGGEAVEVVAYLGDGGTLYPNKRSADKYLPVGRCAEPLMTVAQHQRILAASVKKAVLFIDPEAIASGDRSVRVYTRQSDVNSLPLYTHPADQVADDLTMVKASRELLVKLLDEGRRAETWAAQDELRALLNGGRE